MKSTAVLSIPVDDASGRMVDQVLDRTERVRAVRSGSGAEFQTASELARL